MEQPLKVYVAGKVSKNSHFGRHDWRDEFVAELQELSGIKLLSLDPMKSEVDQAKPAEVFGADAFMISQCDVVIVYLSDDISVGGSQEILIAKYFGKPVIGLAPHGGKFNGSAKEYPDRVVEDYRDPFVFSTCDIVCESAKGVATALKSLDKIHIKSIDIIGDLAAWYQQTQLANNSYLKDL